MQIVGFISRGRIFFVTFAKSGVILKLFFDIFAYFDLKKCLKATTWVVQKFTTIYAFQQHCTQPKEVFCKNLKDDISILERETLND